VEANFILTEYVTCALAEAAYEKLDGGTFSGRIPACIGVVAFGTAFQECEIELQSSREGRILLGLKADHKLPGIDGIDLNKEPEHE